MATTTPNFGWPVPTSTDLVKDGATAMEALGDAIDTSMVDLKGGTTGQILSKATNADMDFTWIANDQGDITGVTAGTGISGGGTSGTVTVTNSMATTIDAKGDLIVGTADNAFARLAAGNSGESIVADSSTSTGLRYTSNFAAGKNAVINGAFNVWQRGTSFSNPASFSYTADRFQVQYDGTGATRTISQQTFTPGTAPVAGYEGTYFFRYAKTVAGSGGNYDVVATRLEDVRLFANQTVTLSFWAKADSAVSLSEIGVEQNFGSGGSSGVFTSGTAPALTTSWARYSFTISIPSISGKTIGTGSYFRVYAGVPVNAARTVDFWGWQLEAGSVATAFQTATGSIQGELAACQRYYYRKTQANALEPFASGYNYSTTSGNNMITLPVPMRTSPTGAFSAANQFLLQVAGTTLTPSAISLDRAGTTACLLGATVSGATAGQGSILGGGISTTAYAEFSAEL